MSLPTFRQSVLAGLESADSVVGTLDLATYQLTIIQRSWSGGVRARGTPGDQRLLAPTWITGKHIKVREVAQSGGRYQVGDMRLGPFRPHYTIPVPIGYNPTLELSGIVPVQGQPGGFTSLQLNPQSIDPKTGKARPGVENIYRLAATDPNGSGADDAGDYALVEFQDDDPLVMYLIVRRRTLAERP